MTSRGRLWESSPPLPREAESAAGISIARRADTDSSSLFFPDSLPSFLLAPTLCPVRQRRFLSLASLPRIFLGGCAGVASRGRLRRNKRKLPVRRSSVRGERNCFEAAEVPYVHTHTRARGDTVSRVAIFAYLVQRDLKSRRGTTGYRA